MTHTVVTRSPYELMKFVFDVSEKYTGVFRTDPRDKAVLMVDLYNDAKTLASAEIFSAYIDVRKEVIEWLKDN